MTLFRSVRTPARLIAVGDVHGCHDELTELLRVLDPRPDDTVVAVGDMVRKGPASARCLDLWRERGYLAVKGNNEIKLLERAHPLFRFFALDTRDVLTRGDLLRYIDSWPLVIDFPDAGVAAVHGGFLPGMNVTPEEVERQQDVIHHLRWIRRRNGTWKSVPKEKNKKEDVLWAKRWRGERFVVYGHTPLREPRFDRRALGLDTGCVYGGALTAAILENGHWRTVSVPARRAYAE